MSKFRDMKSGQVLILKKEIEIINFKVGQKVTFIEMDRERYILDFTNGLRASFGEGEMKEFFDIKNDNRIPRIIELKSIRSEFITKRTPNDTFSDCIDNISLKLMQNPSKELTYKFDKDITTTSCYILSNGEVVGVGVAKLKRGEKFSLDIGYRVAKLKAEINMNNNMLYNINREIDDKLKEL